MTRPEIDPERLAALLDGRLDEHARAELLRELASDDDALEAFADAAAVLAELESSPTATAPATPERAPTPVTPLRPRTRARGVWWGAAAAAAVVLVVGASWLWRTASVPAAGDPIATVAMLDGERPLPADWNGRPWGATRGAVEPLTASARAVRVGASLADLDLAIAARDARATSIADALVALLADVPAGGPVAAAVRDAARRGDRRALRTAAADVARLLGADDVEAGAWTEAARVAAERHDAAFFRRTHATLARIAARPEIDDAARDALARAASVETPSAVDWTALGKGLTTLLATLAR